MILCSARYGSLTKLENWSTLTGRPFGQGCLKKPTLSVVIFLVRRLSYWYVTIWGVNFKLFKSDSIHLFSNITSPIKTIKVNRFGRGIIMIYLCSFQIYRGVPVLFGYPVLHSFIKHERNWLTNLRCRCVGSATQLIMSPPGTAAWRGALSRLFPAGHYLYIQYCAGLHARPLHHTLSVLSIPLQYTVQCHS